MRLSGKVAVITGAGSGIGFAAAVRFRAEGAMVLGVDRDIAPLDAAGIAARAADVTDEAAAEAIVAGCEREFGAPDILVTAAGISFGGMAGDISLERWNTTMTINVTGTFLWIRACLRPMVAHGRGAIVTIASQLAHAGGRGNAAYVTSKGAVLSLTQSVALDYAQAGIRCNAVLPGATETPLLHRSFSRQADPDAARARSIARHPMGRLGQPEEVAAAILYLASGEASFTTGVALPVDGGWLVG